jgi:hypothetical protein
MSEVFAGLLSGVSRRFRFSGRHGCRARGDEGLRAGFAGGRWVGVRAEVAVHGELAAISYDEGLVLLRHVFLSHDIRCAGMSLGCG